jgi:hypothetical protein
MNSSSKFLSIVPFLLLLLVSNLNFITCQATLRRIRLASIPNVFPSQLDHDLRFLSLPSGTHPPFTFRTYHWYHQLSDAFPFLLYPSHFDFIQLSRQLGHIYTSASHAYSRLTMAGGKGKSIGGKATGAKDSSTKTQKSHSAKAGLQVSVLCSYATFCTRVKLHLRQRCCFQVTFRRDNDVAHALGCIAFGGAPWLLTNPAIPRFCLSFLTSAT